MGKESQVEADEHDPETPFAKPLIHHSSHHLWQPVMKRREDRENIRSDQHVMEVSDDEIGVMHLPVDRDDGRENSVQSTNDKQRKKTHGEVHGGGCNRSSLPDGRNPAEDLYSAENRDRHAAGAEKTHRHVCHSHRKHVMKPDTKTNDASQDGRDRNIRDSRR